MASRIALSRPLSRLCPPSPRVSVFKALSVSPIAHRTLRIRHAFEHIAKRTPWQVRFFTSSVSQAAEVTDHSGFTQSNDTPTTPSTPSLAFSLAPASDLSSVNPTVAVFVFEDDAATRFQAPNLAGWFNSTTASEALVGDFKGKPRTSQTVYPSGPNAPSRVLFIGLGKQSAFTVHSLRMATFDCMSHFQRLKAAKASVVLPDLSGSGSSVDAAAALMELSRVASMVNEPFDLHLKKKKDRVQQLSVFHSSVDASLESALQQGAVVAESARIARVLVNQRADIVTPLYMQMQAETIAKKHGLKITVLSDKELRAKGYQLLPAVGQCAVHPARLVAIEYWGKGEDSKSEATAVVGKTLTFDTGGLNLKTGESMYNMHMDMAGGAAVLGVIDAVASLKLKVNLVGVLTIAENAIGNTAVRPKTILQSAKGSVEVSNTDAEGRLALADAFTFVQKTYPIKELIDMATLTGACIMALGEHAAGVFGNNVELTSELVASGANTYERVWPLPVLGDYTAELKGTHSDWKTLGGGKGGGASIAAAFLQIFVEKGVKWAHIDIAGPAYTSKPQHFLPAGGTGFGVALLTDYFSRVVAGKKESNLFGATARLQSESNAEAQDSTDDSANGDKPKPAAK